MIGLRMRLPFIINKARVSHSEPCHKVFSSIKSGIS